MSVCNLEQLPVGEYLHWPRQSVCVDRLAMRLQAEWAVTRKAILVVHARMGSFFLEKKINDVQNSEGKLDIKMLSLVIQVPITSGWYA